ncbi:ferric reductase-like transmembrane domain-containing protein [uncultured Cellulomonas sp.]|uniref:ferric reductase-like transmembrane domain-containing protein n=1 Tax=uncultured Cellulomonas sp. TaxID=189682 RepID=UPI0026295E18|nr:ferric reductase-like transmembrane domain-containing protein [uncultured Cellulomonas sp.]
MPKNNARCNVVAMEGTKQRDVVPSTDGRRSALVRHGVLAVATGLLVLAFWRSRMEWTPDMRLWRAVGDAAIVLLFGSLALGPAARLSVVAARGLRWQRQVGIWTALAALLHSLLVNDGWATWSVQRLLGYEFIPALGREARLEPGFGLANLVGLVAGGWLLVLLATSSDRAVRWLGPRGWKWLHGGSNVVFYLVVLHSGYFLFIHYTASFHRTVPDENWFRFSMLALAAAVLVLKWAAFGRTVRLSRTSAPSAARKRDRS